MKLSLHSLRVASTHFVGDVDVYDLFFVYVYDDNDLQFSRRCLALYFHNDITLLERQTTLPFFQNHPIAAASCVSIPRQKGKKIDERE
jgi:hypothetical protein